MLPSENGPSNLTLETLHILIAEDDDSLKDILQQTLSTPYRVIDVCKNGDEALGLLKNSSFDIVITDLKMSGADGLQVLGEAKRANPDSVVIIMTGYASLDSAIQAIRGGAYDYIRKPFKLDEMEIVVKNASEKVVLLRENRRLVQKLQETMEEMKDLRRKFDQRFAPMGGALELSGEESFSQVNVTLKQVPPDFDLIKEESRGKALQELERVMRLKREGLLDDHEFYALKKVLIKKLSD